jgi:hypothetical protein
MPERCSHVSQFYFARRPDFSGPWMQITLYSQELDHGDTACEIR